MGFRFWEVGFRTSSLGCELGFQDVGLGFAAWVLGLRVGVCVVGFRILGCQGKPLKESICFLPLMHPTSYCQPSRGKEPVRV